jgi:uncharacterized membrane protein
MAGDSDSTRHFEEFPLTREEYITTLVHFYRGEMSRANSWRTRLDTTTNWAVITSGAMLSLSFSGAGHSHITLLLTAVMASVFLGIEARRFRYFDVWRSRVRMIEENFLVPILRRDLVSPRTRWGDLVAHDLDLPTFKLTFMQAVGVRLRRNYIWLYAVIFVAWLAKLNVHPTAAEGMAEVMRRMAIGPVAGELVLTGIGLFWLGVLGLIVRESRRRRHAGEVHGIEKSMDRWKD